MVETVYSLRVAHLDADNIHHLFQLKQAIDVIAPLLFSSLDGAVITDVAANMAADWEEVKRLAADFQRAQLSSTVQRLSERNCVEIVKKLIELKLIDVIFTTDGKEYITPQQLVREIEDELVMHGGRINLADLCHILTVDFSHIEARANELTSNNPDIKLVLGQLISRDYLNQIAEEVNEKLQQYGYVTIADLTKHYDLPSDFLEGEIHSYIGTTIHGQPDPSDPKTIFTEAYLAQHTARIRGVLSGVTRPRLVQSLVSQFRFPERLFYTVVEQLIKDERLAGSLSGGRNERATYIPDMYAKSQNEWVDAFYRQNGYLEYDALLRLGIHDPKGYLKKRFKDESLTYLKSCCVSQNLLVQVEASVEETLHAGTWLDIMSLLPSVMTKSDAQQLMQTVMKQKQKAASQGAFQIFCDTYIVSNTFLQECMKTFEPLITKKAEEAAIKGLIRPPSSAQAKQSKPEKKETFAEETKTSERGNQEKKDDRKKKPAGGKAGGGTQGRETKIKAVKKKYMKGGKGSAPGDESDSEDESSQTSAVTKSSSKQQELQFMSVTEIEEQLRKLTDVHECPDELIHAIAEYLHSPLNAKYKEAAQSVFMASGASRRKAHSDLQEKVNNLLNNITMFEKALKVFSGDLQTQLYKHLLRTLCSDVANTLIVYGASEHGVANETELQGGLTPESRKKLIDKFPSEIKDTCLKLHNSLNAKTLDDFMEQMDAVSSSVCGIIIRRLDKKKERQVLFAHRQALLEQLNETNDPALCLHLAVLLVFQGQTRHMLHASGKFVPQIISYLQKHVPNDVYALFHECQDLVIKQLTIKDDDEKNKADIEALIAEMIPKVKEVATTFKKTSQSEAEPQ